MSNMSHWFCHTCFGEMWLMLGIRPGFCAYCGCRFTELRKRVVEEVSE